MHTVALTTLSLALVGATLAGALMLVPVFDGNADNPLLTLLAEVNALSSSTSPDTSAQCFNYYHPSLRRISKNFSVAYEKCLTNTNATASSGTSNFGFNQSEFIVQSKIICNALTECTNGPDIPSFFNCLASAAFGNVGNLYSLLGNALKASITLKSGLNKTIAIRELCTYDAETKYLMQTSKVYEELKACFLNGLPSTTIIVDPVSTAGTSSSEGPVSTAIQSSSADPSDLPTFITIIPSASLTSASSSAPPLRSFLSR